MHASRGIRRHHQKSRTGCLTCRQRRVKCDEERPCCRNCLKRDVSCAWAECNTFASSSAEATRSNSVNSGTNGSQALVPSNGLSVLDMLGIELMHYWMAHTSLSLMMRPHPEAVQCVQIIGPRLALRNPSLLNAMFALTALHIHISEHDFVGTKTKHSKDYLSISRNLFSLGAQEIPPSPRGYDPENSEVLFLNYGLLLIYLFAAPWIHDDFGWIKTAREYGQSMLENWGPFSGKVAPVIPTGDLHLEMPEISGPQRTFVFPSILKFIHKPGAPDQAELYEPQVAYTYELAVNQLQFLWMLSLDGNIDQMNLFVWPSCMPERFLSFILEKRPRALVIFAHYCLLLNATGHWLVKNRGKVDTERIMNLVGEEWHAWMQLPLDQLSTPTNNMLTSELQALLMVSGAVRNRATLI